MQKLRSLISEHLSQIEDKEESCRLFHGRGKKWSEYSHLSIDWYSPTVLITSYRELSESEKRNLLEIISTIDNLPCENILLQKRYLRGETPEILKGELLGEAVAVENSEKYLLQLKNPQNIGFFLDMRIGREWLRANGQNKKILNLFSYTCSLSVAALNGGAKEVINVDMSKSSLNIGEKNHLLNGFQSKAKFIPYDIMNSFGNLKKKGPYDLVLIDPPTNQGDSFKVERDYFKIIKKLSDMTNPQAQVMACLNSPFLTSEFLLNAFKDHAPNFIFHEKISSSFESMESNSEEGLKILIFNKI